VVDYYENQGFALGHYLKVLQDRAYVYGDCWLPHDADNELLSSERTITQQVRAFGYKARVLPRISIASGIEAARAIFPNCYFDQDKCADGLHCLRHYRYDVDPETNQYSNNPLHDWASHGADAFRYLAMALREVVKKPQKEIKPRPRVGAQSWMG
jgi:phage terminase large subunit